MMSEEYYDHFNPNHSEDTSAQSERAENTAAQSEYAETAAFQQPAMNTEPATPAQSDVSGSTAPQPFYTNPYASSYRPAQADRPLYTERSASANSDSFTQPHHAHDDGFYHHSFTQDSTGNHVNYIHPAAPTTPASPAPKREKKRSRGISKGAIAVLMIFCVLLSGAAGFGGSMLANNMNKQSYSADGDTMVIHKVNAEVTAATEAALADKTTAEITQEVADTVVEITTEVVQTSSFYGQYIAQGAGSGVIISADGYILTNNHVIDGASSITVTTRSGDTYEAELVGTDSEVDIALLKIDASDLPVAVFGDSSTLEVGSKAVIIGNPLGTLGGSVTEGIISALDRSIAIDGKTMHLMQTDAAINPGNSGGGMFNGQGELTGIVVAKSSSEEIDNIGFVIPINNVLDILGDLKDYGYVRGRADTGMTFIDLSNQMYAWYYYNNSEAGVYISSVDSGSNAYEAGFREGDRVISVDGQTVSTSDDIESIISEKSAGDTVSFELQRSGSKGTLELTLEEAVPDSVQLKNNSRSENSSPFGNGGLFNR